MGEVVIGGLGVCAGLQEQLQFAILHRRDEVECGDLVGQVEQFVGLGEQVGLDRDAKDLLLRESDVDFAFALFGEGFHSVFREDLLGLSKRLGQHLDQLRRSGEAGNHGHGQGGDAADEHPAQILHVLEERLDRAAEFLAVFVQLGHRVVAIGVTAAWNR